MIRKLVRLIWVLIPVCSTVLSYVIDFGEPRRTDFTYNIDFSDPLGVYNWHLSYPEYCGGNQQSPVNIDTRFVRYNPNLPCPVIHYDTAIVTGNLKNNGHSVRFKPANPMAFTLTNAPYRIDEYVLNDFHIHYGGQYPRFWSRPDMPPGYLYPGAEHTLNRYRYDGEIHLVFKNSRYGPRDRSVFTEEDGLVVMALFVQVLPDIGVSDLRFSRFLEEHIPSVQSINDTETISVDMSMLFPPSCSYYTYHGSKTVPNCGESVRWIVFTDIVQVTQSAWSQLSSVESRGGFVSLFGNFRHTQPLNHRVVETNIPPPD